MPYSPRRCERRGMKNLTIEFDNFTLFINVKQQFVVYMNWLGKCETYSMNEFFEVLEKIKANR